MSVSAVYDYVRCGEIPNIGVGAAVRIPRIWLEQRFSAAGVSMPPKFETVAVIPDLSRSRVPRWTRQTKW